MVVKIKHPTRLHIGLDTSRNQLNLPGAMRARSATFLNRSQLRELSLSLGSKSSFVKLTPPARTATSHAFPLFYFAVPIILNCKEQQKPLQRFLGDYYEKESLGFQTKLEVFVYGLSIEHLS